MAPLARRATAGRLVLGVALAATCSAMAAAPAGAVECNEVVTHSARLDRDLVDCGFTIAGNDVTVDFAGHSVEGFVSLVAITGDRVTIRDGTISSGTGGLAVEGDDARVAGMNVSSGRIAVRSTGARPSFLRSDISGLVPFDATGVGVRVHASKVSGFATTAILAISGDAARITRNVVAGGGRGGPPASVGIRVTGDGALVARNTVRATFQRSIELTGAGGSIVANAIDGLQRTFGTSGDGIVVTSASNAVAVRNNVAGGFTGDGIRALGMATLLRGNRAFANGGLGINAVAGSIDGGGNRAFENGDARQCVGVVCRGA